MIQSPCIKICILNIDGVCVGCGRDRMEISIWSNADEEGKREILRKSSTRRSMQTLRNSHFKDNQDNEALNHL